MPSADVVVVGAGLSGLTTAITLAEAGASVWVVANGMAATHWAHGGVDVAALPGTATSREGVGALASRPGHPYALVSGDLEPALGRHLRRLEGSGLPYRGGLDAPLVAVPTALGSLRRAAIVPAGQAGATQPWRGERLLVVGIRRFRDFAAPFVARNLARTAWPDRPAEVRAAEVDLPGVGARHNLGPLDLARLFDDVEWGTAAIAAVRRAVPPGGGWRLALPAVLGLTRHAAILRSLEEATGGAVFEIASVPPSVPGLRLFEVLRRRLAAAGGRLELGNPVVDVERDAGRVTAISVAAAARSRRLAAAAFVLATGGIAGGGLVGNRDGTLSERVFGLPVEAPARANWFAADPLGGDEAPLALAGIHVDGQLRPMASDGSPATDNVHVVGSALAGMRYLSERCGDGVALASAERVARLLSGETAAAAQPGAEPPVRAVA